MTPTDIGSRLRKLREQRQLSQRDVAKRAGLSHTAVGNAEKGVKTSDEAFTAIARVLGQTYAVGRTLVPAGVQVMPVLMPTDEALQREQILAQGADVAAATQRLMSAIGRLDPYHRELLTRQAELLVQSYESEDRASR